MDYGRISGSLGEGIHLAWWAFTLISTFWFFFSCFYFLLCRHVIHQQNQKKAFCLRFFSPRPPPVTLGASKNVLLLSIHSTSINPFLTTAFIYTTVMYIQFKSSGCSTETYCYRCKEAGKMDSPIEPSDLRREELFMEQVSGNRLYVMRYLCIRRNKKLKNVRS